MNCEIFICLFVFFNLILFVRGNFQNVRHHELKRTEDHLHVNKQDASLITKARAIYCSDINCELIEEFKVADNNNLGCYEKYLGIEFTIPIMNKFKNDTENVPVYAFLSYEANVHYFNVLSNVQEYSDTCESVKK